jgi:hypothetical protein
MQKKRMAIWLMINAQSGSIQQFQASSRITPIDEEAEEAEEG